MLNIQFRILIFLLCISFFLKCNSTTDPDDPDNNPPAISNLIANPDSIIMNDSCEITCIANDPDGDSLNYAWQSTAGAIVGSGSVVSWNAPDSMGEYFITCKVLDGNGGEAMDNVKIVVLSNEPSASFIMNKTNARIGEVITFTNTSQNTTSYDWDFGDGNSSTEENPTYAYSDTGLFTITLIGHGALGSSSVSNSTTIGDPVLKLTFYGNGVNFEGHTNFKEGYVEFYFYNQSSGLASANLVKHDSGYTHQDMLNTFTNGFSAAHHPSWTTEIPGAWNEIDAGTYHTWTENLMPGLYTLVSVKTRSPGIGAWYGAGLTVYN